MANEGSFVYKPGFQGYGYSGNPVVVTTDDTSNLVDTVNPTVQSPVVSNGLASSALSPDYYKSYKDYMGSDALGGLTTKGGLQDISTGIGIVGAGYGIYDSLLGNTAKLNSKKMELMDQQIASNKQNMANKDAFNNTWAGASNGLAAKYATPRVG